MIWSYKWIFRKQADSQIQNPWIVTTNCVWGCVYTYVLTYQHHIELHLCMYRKKTGRIHIKSLVFVDGFEVSAFSRLSIRMNDELTSCPKVIDRKTECGPCVFPSLVSVTRLTIWRLTWNGSTDCATSWQLRSAWCVESWGTWPSIAKVCRGQGETTWKGTRRVSWACRCPSPGSSWAPLWNSRCHPACRQWHFPLGRA